MRIKNKELRIKHKKLYSSFLPLNSSAESGQILVLVFTALGVVLFIVLFLIGGAQLYFQNAVYFVNAEKATALAEAGVDKALESLNKTGGIYNGELETTLGDGSYSVSVTDKDAGTKVLQVTGYIPNKASPKVKRTISVQVSKGVGIAFVYGLQVGEGGLQMGNESILNGSIYSNGNIVGGNQNTIIGDAWVAGGGQPTADQQTDCIPPNCTDFIFGRYSGQALDVVQSFKPSTTAVINKVALKLKKFDSPPNLTVRILGNSSDQPNKNDVKTSGTLSANLVTNSYDFVEVSFTSNATLSAETTYWVMIDTSANSANYWAWQQDLTQSYTRGQAKWSPNWNSGNPSWNNINGDLGFKIYMGGVITKIQFGDSSVVNGDVRANTITGSNWRINGDAYYQSLNPQVTVSGTTSPGSQDPSPQVFPISEANITAWKAEAEAGGVTDGSLAYGNNCFVTLGPQKITGSVSFGNSCTVTVKSPVWIAGALSAGNETIFKLDSSFGVSSGMIIVDGVTSLGNECDLRGSGTAGSYLMLLSTYNQASPGDLAVSMGNESISGIIYAPYGTVNLPNVTSFKEISAYKIVMGNKTTLTYETGLANLFFSSGPTGSYSLVKGTYQVK